MPDINSLPAPPIGSPVTSLDIIVVGRPGPVTPPQAFGVTYDLFATNIAGTAAGTLTAGNDFRLPDAPAVTTTGSVPAVLAGLRTIPAGAAAMTITGHVLARNPATGDCSRWDVAALVKVVAGVASLVGAANVSLFAQDAGLAVAAVAVTGSATGVVVTVTGLAGATVIWTSSMTVSVG